MKTHYFIEPIPNFIRNEIKRELEKCLPEYNFIEAHYKSAYKDDEYLYLVLALSKDYYSFWTYNTITKSFNHGHYGITNQLLALGKMEELFHE